MVALNITFAVIVMVLTVGIILLIASGTFGDIKTVFEKWKPLPEIPITGKPCTKSDSGGSFAIKLSAEVGRPAQSKKLELIPVFIYDGKVYRNADGKITLEDKESHTVPIASEIITTSIPKKVQSYIVALLADDEKCANLVKSKPAFDEFTKECGQFVLTTKSFPVEGDCVDTTSSGTPPLTGGGITEMLSVESVSKSLTRCGVKATVKNTDVTEWTVTDKVKAVLFCKGNPGLPQIPLVQETRDLTLKAGEFQIIDFSEGCEKGLGRYRAAVIKNCQTESCNNPDINVLTQKEFTC